MTIKSSVEFLRLQDIKSKQEPLLENEAAQLWDLGDGVVCFEFKTKENTFTPKVFEIMGQTIELVENKYKALVFYNDTKNFSLGMNINLVVDNFDKPDFQKTATQFLQLGQKILRRLKFSPFPVVGAPHGLAVGGGCELLLHCDAIVADEDINIGLVEVAVGIVPGWGGCKEMLLRNNLHHKFTGFKKTFETIAAAKVSKSATHARKLGFLRDTDTIVTNIDNQLFQAKQRAIELAKGYQAPQEQYLRLPGKLGAILLKMGVHSLRKAGKISNHDVYVVETLAHVVTGGNTNPLRKISEQSIFDLELEANIKLIKSDLTKTRFLHFSKTGEILRN